MSTVGVFYFPLLSLLWFEVAAAVFLFVMTQLYWTDSSFSRRLVLSWGIPFLFVFIFQWCFDLTMPGKGTLTEYIFFAFR